MAIPPNHLLHQTPLPSQIPAEDFMVGQLEILLRGLIGSPNLLFSANSRAKGLYFCLTPLQAASFRAQQQAAAFHQEDQLQGFFVHELILQMLAVFAAKSEDFTALKSPQVKDYGSLFL
jgi:hypothetical protein